MTRRSKPWRMLALAALLGPLSCDPLYRYEGVVLTRAPSGTRPLEGASVVLSFQTDNGPVRWPMTTDVGGRFQTTTFHQGIPVEGAIFEFSKPSYKPQTVPLATVCSARDRFGCTAVGVRIVLDPE